MKILLFCLLFSVSAMANRFGYLDEKDQTYYKNNSQSGQNSMERIDSSVRKINKPHGEKAKLKAELAALKLEVAQLRNKKD